MVNKYGTWSTKAVLFAWLLCSLRIMTSLMSLPYSFISFEPRMMLTEELIEAMRVKHRRLMAKRCDHSNDLPFDDHVKKGLWFPEYLQQVIGLIDSPASHQAELISRLYDQKMKSHPQTDFRKPVQWLEWFGVWINGNPEEEVYECALTRVRLTQNKEIANPDMIVYHPAKWTDNPTQPPANVETLAWTLESSTHNLLKPYYPEFDWLANYRSDAPVLDLGYGWAAKKSTINFAHLNNIGYDTSHAQSSGSSYFFTSSTASPWFSSPNSHSVSALIELTPPPSDWPVPQRIYRPQDISGNSHTQAEYHEIAQQEESTPFSNFHYTLAYIRHKLVKSSGLGLIPGTTGNNLVWWLVSNCNSPRRNEKAGELIREAPEMIDVYGSCAFKAYEIWGGKPWGVFLDSPCGPRYLKNVNTHLEITCYKQHYQQYLFYMSYENSRSVEYITEKLWRPLMVGNVPIVWGARREDYEKVLPPNSFIYADDFKTTGDLIEYLIFLKQNPEFYNQYHLWRNEYSVSIAPERLSLCMIADTIAAKKELGLTPSKKFSMTEWKHSDPIAELDARFGV